MGYPYVNHPNLIKKAPNLSPIRTYLGLGEEYLNSPKDPEIVYQDLEELQAEWWSPMLQMVLYLKGKAKLAAVKESLNLQEEDWDNPKDFRKELKELTLEEFLSLVPQT